MSVRVSSHVSSRPARDAQQLLGVVPLVQRPGLVDALVALEADQPGAGAWATALASSVLPTPAGPSTSSGLPSAVGQEDGGGDGGGGQIAGLGEARGDVVDGVNDCGLRLGAGATVSGHRVDARTPI